MKIRPRISAFAMALGLLLTPMVVAAQESGAQLKYNVYYQCNGERIAVGHCRKDSDIPGAFPTAEQQNYCLVYYPDRPGRGATMVQASELRSDIIRKLQACGALAGPQQQPEKNAKTYHEEGLRLAEAKKYPEAIHALKTAVLKDPYDLQMQFDLGAVYNRAGQYDLAISIFRQMLNEDLSGVPDMNANVLSQLGMARAISGHSAEAVAALKQLVALQPNSSEAWFELGGAYVLLGDRQQALQVYNKLLTMDKAKAQQLADGINSKKWDAQGKAAPPNQAKAFLDQGEKYRQAGEYPKAIEAYKKVIALAPNSGLAGDAYHGIGWIDLEQKNYQIAVTNLNEALRLRPEDAEVNFECGKAFMYNGIMPRAVALYKEAIHLQPDFADAYYYLGLTYDMMGNKQEAMQVYQKLKTVDKKSAQELYNQIQKSK